MILRKSPLLICLPVFISLRAFNAAQNTAKWKGPLCLANKTACSFEEIGRGVGGTGLRRRSVRVLLRAAITWPDNCYLWSGSMLLVPRLRCVWYVTPETHRAKLAAWEAQCSGQKGLRIMNKKTKHKKKSFFDPFTPPSDRPPWFARDKLHDFIMFSPVSLLCLLIELFPWQRIALSALPEQRHRGTIIH